MEYKNKFIEILGEPYDENKLNEYIEFVINNVYVGENTEIHHILPRSIFDENDETYSLKYNDHITAHKLLAEAYPIREFTRPLNFMLPKSDRDLIEYRKLISIATKVSWRKFKESPKYQEWRKKKSILMKNRNEGGLASEASKSRYEKNPNARKEIGEMFSLLWKDPDFRQKTISNMKLSAAKPEAKKKRQESAKKRWARMSEEDRLKFCETMKEVNSRMDKKQTAGEKMKQKWQEPEFRKNMENKNHGSDSATKSATMKELWKDSVYRKKMLDARKKK